MISITVPPNSFSGNHQNGARGSGAMSLSCVVRRQTIQLFSGE